MAKQYYADDWLSIWEGDCRAAMAQMEPQSVQSVITSPPFYGLRNYSTAKWEGGDPDCDHTKVASGRGTNIPQTKNPNVDYPIAPHRGGNPNLCVRCGAVRIEPTVWGGDPAHAHVFGDDIPGSNRGGSGTPTDKNGRGEDYARADPRGAFCECGAWRGALGLEPTPELYVEHLVEVFEGVWRVLRDDGIAWLNLGDSWANDTKWGGASGGKHAAALHGQTGIGRQRVSTGLKAKDVIGIPWRVAFALQSAGWYLRSEVIWVKPNAMPTSVKDRPTPSHESIFLLTKNPHYFFDMEAVKEPVGDAMIAAAKRKAVEPGRTYQHDEETRFGKTSPNRVWSDPEAVQRLLAGRHMRDVLTVNTAPYAGAHYAVFPPKLIEPLIKAATSEGGCCPRCGTPLKRITVAGEAKTVDGKPGHDKAYGHVMHGMDDLSGKGITGGGFAITEQETVGWEPTCGHVEPQPPRPCVVFDPFGGSGTVGMVAQQLGRRAVLVDLNPEYLEQQLVRNRDVPLGL